MVTIEESAAELDEAVRAVRQLPWGEQPPETHAVLENYQEKKRALALAVLKETHGDCWSSACGSVQRDGSIWRCGCCRIRARIRALGS